jgi:hypothetical protein
MEREVNVPLVSSREGALGRLDVMRPAGAARLAPPPFVAAENEIHETIF